MKTLFASAIAMIADVTRICADMKRINVRREMLSDAQGGTQHRLGVRIAVQGDKQCVIDHHATLISAWPLTPSCQASQAPSSPNPSRTRRSVWSREPDESMRVQSMSPRS